MGRERVWLVCAATALFAACGRGPEPSVEACAQILAARLPEADVVEARAEAGVEAELAFEVGAWWKEGQRGRLACSFEAQPGGGLRLRAASLDGQAFTNAELTVINADLLLAEMRRAGAERRD